MEDGPLHTFSRVAKRDPPTDREYLTPQDKLGPPGRHSIPRRGAAPGKAVHPPGWQDCPV